MPVVYALFIMYKRFFLESEIVVRAFVSAIVNTRQVIIWTNDCPAYAPTLPQCATFRDYHTYQMPLCQMVNMNGLDNPVDGLTESSRYFITYHQINFRRCNDYAIIPSKRHCNTVALESEFKTAFYWDHWNGSVVILNFSLAVPYVAKRQLPVQLVTKISSI